MCELFLVGTRLDNLLFTDQKLYIIHIHSHVDSADGKMGKIKTRALYKIVQVGVSKEKKSNVPIYLLIVDLILNTLQPFII